MAINQVEGSWWAQLAWFATAVVLTVVGHWVTQRILERGHTLERGRPDASVTAPPPVMMQVSAAVSDETRQGKSDPVVVGKLLREPVGFQPRPELMARLEEAAASGKAAVVCALTGARGVGKTHLAAAYARQCAERGWRLVAWINAESRDRVLAGLDAIAAAVRLPQDEDSTVTAERVREWLNRQTERCLVVFDNAVDPGVIEPWLPAVGRVQVVISSTHRGVEVLGERVAVDVFTEDEAVQFLAERTGRVDEAGARLLAEEVGRLPLALAQAAWVIRQQGVSYQDYVHQLRTVKVKQVLRPVRGEGYPHGAAEAVLLSLKQIGRGRKVRLERGLLDLLSVLSSAGVPRQWLHEAAREGMLGKVDGDVAARVDAAIGHLAESSLITISVDGSTVGMHRFIQRVLRDAARMKRRLGTVLAQAAAVVASHHVPLERVALERPGMEAFVEQAAALWANVDHPASKSPRRVINQALRLRDWAGQCLKEAGDLSRAIPMHKQVLDDRMRVLGADHPDTLTSRNNLASAYHSAGKLDQAITLYKQVLDDRMRVLGADHPDTLTSRNNLASAYHSAGKLDQAITLYKQVLDDRMRVLGADHPDTLTSRNNLAYAYHSAGKLDQAITLYKQVLDDRMRVLGADHPDTLASRNNLAGAYHSAGKLDQAITLLEQTLNDRMRVLGADHPDTLASRNNLAYAYHSAGKLDQAIPLYKQTLNDSIRILGADHPDTLASRNNLASAYHSAGKLDQAITLLEQTLNDSIRILGADHPDTLTSRNNLAGAYESAGKLDQAITLYKQTLNDRMRVLGADHPDTLTSRNNLAGAYESAGKLDKAITLYEQTLNDRMRVLGADHPDTLASRNNLASAYESAGKLDKAITLYKQTLNDSMRVLGAEHPLTKLIAGQLAEVRDLGQD
ncbi:Tetratricopeptide (TPR) repeat [Thermostaphylospora chromogena]|uniref:Tetratricopeptide (TPR) repeat n=1 Tax=Thermostaphylospora chromogena TaxID=35622 RepID=A0A1H1FY13_9ACTN|nr:Tetratricopeptide (TPR) repeat [Thermostaphylospora chromogena]